MRGLRHGYDRRDALFLAPLGLPPVHVARVGHRGERLDLQRFARLPCHGLEARVIVALGGHLMRHDELVLCIHRLLHGVAGKRFTLADQHHAVRIGESHARGAVGGRAFSSRLQCRLCLRELLFALVQLLSPAWMSAAVI